MGQPDRWSSIISRDKTGGGSDVQDRDRLELDCVVEAKCSRSRMMGPDWDPCFFGLFVAPWRYADFGQRRNAGSYAGLVWEIRSSAL